MCEEYDKENKKQREDMDEKDKTIQILMQKKENLVALKKKTEHVN